MEVANASMYDGVDRQRRGGDDGRSASPRRKRAVLSGGLHPHYREVCETLARFVGFELIARADAGRGRRSAPLIDDDTACVVVQNPDVFGRCAIGRPIAEAGHAKGALLIVVVTEIVSLGLFESARRDGRRHRRRRRPIDRQWAQFRRALCRAVRQPRTIRAPDAGPPRRRDRRRRGPARLGADPVDPRAAHPPRARRPATSAPIPACARWPSRSIWRCWARTGSSGSRGSTTPPPWPWPNGSKGCRASSSSPAPSSTNSPCACRVRPRRSSTRWRRKACSPACRLSRLYPDRPELADLLMVAATETMTDGRYRPARRALDGGLAVSGWSQAASRPPGRGHRRCRRRPSAATAGCRSRKS